jgi:hypothetical protein
MRVNIYGRRQMLAIFESEILEGREYDSGAIH